MAECVSCGTRVEEGITRCPQCGADLVRPGAFLQILGWVTVCISTIPLSVGAIAAEQRNYIPLGIGIGVLVLGVAMVLVGRSRGAGVREATRPSPGPASPPPPAGLAR